MATIDPAATSRREEHRDPRNGQFGEHSHSVPDITLEAPEAGEWEPEPLVYTMPLSMVPEARKRVERANRRLERAGVHERFELDVEEFVYVPENDVVGVSAARVSLNAPVLSVSGWKFAGAHEMTADGHIVNYGATKVTEMRCDHCGHARRRGKVFTVVSEDGEQKVVGSNCLTAFLGVRPEGLWSLTFDFEGGTEEDAERDIWASAVGDKVVPALDLIGAALAASGDGVSFVPKSRASINTPSTAELVRRELRGYVVAGEEPERRAHAERILSWVNAQPEGGSDYIDNLRSVLAGKERWVGQKHFGIGVSAVAAHRNALEWAERDAQRKQEAAALYSQGHVGDVGVRFRDRPMTVQVVDVSDGEYGPNTRLVFRDDETGRQILWWASGDRSFELKEGGSVSLTATVSEHSEFKGADQTVVKRGKMTFPEGA